MDLTSCERLFGNEFSQLVFSTLTIPLIVVGRSSQLMNYTTSLSQSHGVYCDVAKLLTVIEMLTKTMKTGRKRLAMTSN